MKPAHAMILLGCAVPAFTSVLFNPNKNAITREKTTGRPKATYTLLLFLSAGVMSTKKHATIKQTHTKSVKQPPPSVVLSQSCIEIFIVIISFLALVAESL